MTGTMICGLLLMGVAVLLVWPAAVVWERPPLLLLVRDVMILLGLMLFASGFIVHDFRSATAR